MRKLCKKTCYLIIVLYFTMVSCGEIEYKPSGAGDAIIFSQVTDTDTLFGLGLHAYTYGEFSIVTAYNTSNPSRIFTLVPFNEYNKDMSYETPKNEMTHELPPVGEYTFEASFPGDEFLTFSDLLTSEYVLPPVITKCEYDSEQDKVIVSWGDMVNSEILNIKLFNLQKELLYMSPSINKVIVIYTFDTNNSGWQTENLPVPGQQYIVEISTFVFEPLNGGSLNIQATGRVEKIITWSD